MRGFDLTEFLDQLRQLNRNRQAEWPADIDVDMLFRATELGGECGELLGAVKKLYRSLHNIKGNGGDLSRYITNAKEEIGDVLICLDLLSSELEKTLSTPFNLEQYTKDKFNTTSEKLGLSTKFEGV